MTTALAVTIVLASCGTNGTEADGRGDTATDEADTTGGCVLDEDCDDGIYCNGGETCGEDGTCREGDPVDCDDADPCTVDACVEEEGACVYDPLDADGDGWAAETAPTGEECGGEDCNDGAASIYPEAPEESCDLADSDCDGDSSEHIDDDGDGWVDAICDGAMEDSGAYEGMGDCDDGAEDVYPGAHEGCDGTIDNDCDGDATEVVEDADGDGFAPASCGGTDCDDSDPDVHPGAEETCDSVDDDCDGEVLDAPGADDDSDGHLDELCGGDDCDDSDPDVHPGAEETCDSVDDDCDGEVLDAPGADDDSDTFLDAGCGGTDCNDFDPNTYPGAPEMLCDSVDNDCDGDELDGTADQDGDDYLNDACPGGTDCDDLDPDVHPGAAVTCDDVDDDCSGTWADEAGADDDSDGYLDGECGGDDCDDGDADVSPAGVEDGCDSVDDDCDGDAIDGWADQDGDDYLNDACPGGTDCDDLDPDVHPGAAVTCDDVDDDCSGTWADEAGADDDSDGYLDGECGGDDCDDGDASVYGGASEVCGDGVDQDCDTLVDGLVALVGEEKLIDTDTNCLAGAVTWTGSEFATAWTDAGPGYGYDVFFGRFDAAGSILASDVLVTDAFDNSEEASLAWTGSEIVLAWEDIRVFPRGVWLTRLDPLGTKLVSDVQITDPEDRSYGPSVAWSDSEIGLAWHDQRDGNYEVYFARVSADGARIGSEVRVTDAIGHSRHTDTVWTGSEWLIVWDDYRSAIYQVYLARLDAAGAPIGSDVPITTDTNASQMPTCAWTGSELGIVWHDDRDGDLEIYFGRADGTGARLGTDVRLTDRDGGSTEPVIVASAGGYYVAWMDDMGHRPQIYAMEIDSTGAAIGVEIQVSTGSSFGAYHPDMAMGDGAAAVTWFDDRDGDDDHYFSIIAPCD